MSLWRNYPVTVAVALLALIVHAVPSLATVLQLDFDAVGDGQWWRVFTGHLAHYDGGHLFWDLLMFAVLGAACERQNPRLFAPALLLMTFGISASIGYVCPEITVYRGLSGIDTGLFVWLAGIQILQSRQDRDAVSALLWLVPCVGLIGKLFYEAATGQTLFVDSAGFIPLVESHLAGAAIGLLLPSCSSRLSTGRNLRRQPTRHDRYNRTPQRRFKAYYRANRSPTWTG